MLFIPAVDIRNGKCVRLLQGKADMETVYGDNPLEIAVNWEKAGAPMIHVVDLDGAFEGVPKNASLIESILLNVHVPVQIGGGIRSPATIERYINAGASRIVLGTLAYHNFGFVSDMATEYPGKIIIGLDAKDGMVAVDGWVRKTELTAAELAKDYEGTPIGGFVYTDISRDGMQKGPNLDAVKAFCGSTEFPVIASGGVGDVEDLRKLQALNLSNLFGVIAGKALYTGNLRIEEALLATSA